ncbi:hypothetical protein FKM82_008085 [Ascaphus truei]
MGPHKHLKQIPNLDSASEDLPFYGPSGGVYSFDLWSGTAGCCTQWQLYSISTESGELIDLRCIVISALQC